MLSPLNRRLPRLLRKEIGKYLGIFLLLVTAIALVAGFLVASSSIQAIIDEMPERYRMEDARVTAMFEADDEALRQAAEEADARIFPLFSIDTDLSWTADAAEADGTRESESAQVRLYANRTDVDLAAYAQGCAPETESEIALDRVFCHNNGLEIGDEVVVAGRTLTVCGIVTLADYSSLFVNNSDFIFDGITFSVAQVTQGLFDRFVSNDMAVTYTYAVEFEDKNLSLSDRVSAEEDLATDLLERGVAVSDLVDKEANQSISYTSDDVDSDQSMWKVFLFLLLIIMAFVFVVLTSSMIEDESAIIGTLLASGYRKGELVRHYLILPSLVGIAAAAAGNLIGYFAMADPMSALYYNSYSLPPYVARWNTEVFLLTTVAPLVLLIGITFIGLVRKLKYTPLRFLRHDISKTGVRSQVRLPRRFSFAMRFRLRVFLRNLGNFVTLFLGIAFASTLLLFGLCMMPVIENHAENLKNDTVAAHQYLLKAPVDLTDQTTGEAEGDRASDSDGPYVTSSETDRAPERYAATSLETAQFIGDGKETVSVYGIVAGSGYWEEAAAALDGLEDGAVSTEEGEAVPVAIGEGLAEKAGLKVGDVRTFDNPIIDETYLFQVEAIVGSGTNTDVFMPLSIFNETFGNDPDWFNGYVSDEAIDVDPALIVSDLTPEDMDRIVTQMNDSMGDMTQMLLFAAALVYVVLMYLLTKTVIDRSARSISYMKVFGYRDREVDSLYVRSITETVVVSLVVSLPLIVFVLTALFRLVMLDLNGNVVITLPPHCLAAAVGIGLACYALVACLHLRGIRRIPLALALKHQE